jgi:Cell Wall Hydrolase
MRKKKLSPALVPELQLEPEWAELQLSPDAIIRTTQRFLPLAAALVVLAFVIGYAFSPRFGSEVKRYRLESDLTMAIPDMPVVEPLILKNVTKDVAKKVNDATPFTAHPIAPAAPFFATGSAASIARATDCLAATIFYEAGAEPVSGQMAVVQVVLNRMRHPAYPKSVCGVVFQGHERRTGCQFSYTCDGAMARRPSEAAWQRARGLARSMLNGLVYAPVGLATHYHTDWVLPRWSAQLDKVRVERTHLFFRYLGYWGTPKAFKGRYSANEPTYAKLGWISSAHKSAETPVEPALAPLTTTPLTPMDIARDMPDRVSETVATEDKSKDTFIIYVDPLLDSASLEALGDRACGSRNYCKVLAWADYALLPKGLPIDPSERASMAFSYFRNRSAGVQKALWNCALFPSPNRRSCLPGTHQLADAQ